jgi:hypothetical protein
LRGQFEGRSASLDQDEILARVPGAVGLVEWFGHWPSFHDAEIVGVELNRMARSRIKVHTFATTDEVNSRGYYVTVKHALVSFLLENISDLNLAGFNDQNVISGLNVQKTEDGYELFLDGCYGIAGRVKCAQLLVEIEPGMPPHSVYSKVEQV